MHMRDDTRFEDNRAPEYLQSGRQYHHFWKIRMTSFWCQISFLIGRISGTRMKIPVGTRYLQSGRHYVSFWKMTQELKIVGSVGTRYLQSGSKYLHFWKIRMIFIRVPDLYVSISSIWKPCQVFINMQS